MIDYTTYKAEDFLLDESFLRYCSNIEADKAFWENFIAANPQALPEIKDAKKLFSLISISVSNEDKLLAANKLKAQINALYEPAKKLVAAAPVYAISTKTKKWLPRFIAAAVVIGIVICSALVYNAISVNSYNTPVAEFKKAQFEKVYESGDNGRKTIELPDGSTVVLNYGSVLKISGNYNETQRWVYLEGEAFFSVKPDKLKPFVVITDKTATSALGTSFKVRSYKNEEISNVMLATGKVKVQAMANKVAPPDMILLPGEQAICLNSNLQPKTAFNQETLADWRSMKIIFDKANLDKIIATLQFYYGVQVELQNKPGTEIAFTGKFSEQSLKEVLEAISFTNKFTYTQKQHTISILFQ